MISIRTLPIVTAFAALAMGAAGCGSHEDAHAHVATDGGAPGAVPTDAATGRATEDPAIAAPSLDRAMRMDDGVHVMWTNPAARCEAVRGERSKDGAGWVAAFRVEGSFDNLHDGALAKNALYTYRLRCEIGGRVSRPSNEKSAYL